MNFAVFQITTFSEDGKQIWMHTSREDTKVVVHYAVGEGLAQSRTVELNALLYYALQSQGGGL